MGQVLFGRRSDPTSRRHPSDWAWRGKVGSLRQGAGGTSEFDHLGLGADFVRGEDSSIHQELSMNKHMGLEIINTYLPSFLRKIIVLLLVFLLIEHLYL